MLLLLFNSSVQGSIPTGVDIRDVLSRLYPMLGAGSASDLVFWTDEELYEWADEAAKRLARLTGVFVERDSSIAVVAATRSYTLPARHVSSIHVSLDTTRLKPETIPELEALDDGWLAASGTPTRWYQDGEGVEKISLYKIPVAGGTVNVIHHQFPAEITASAFTVDMPSPIQDYFTFWILGQARRRESDGAMPEVAAHCEQMTALFEQVFQAYWGVAQ